MIEKRNPILVIGDWILDKTTYVRVRGPSPENKNILVVKKLYTEYGLGGAANVAMNAHSMGGDVCTFGITGSDPAGDKLISLFESAGLTAHRQIQSGDFETPLKNRIVSGNGQMMRIDQETLLETVSYGHSGWLLSYLDAYGKKRPVVCLVNYDKGFFAHSVQPLMMKLNEIAFFVLVDPGKRNNWERFGSEKTVLKVNMEQSYAFVSQHNPELLGYYIDPERSSDLDHYLQLGRALYAACRERKCLYHYLWITLGAGGMMLIDVDGKISHVGIVDTSMVIDVCGAGDTAMATMAYGLSSYPSITLDPADMYQLMCRANRVAARAVQHRGIYVAKPGDFHENLA